MPTVTSERVFAVFETVEGPVITSGDVAAELDCTAEAARRTLEELHEEGKLGRRKTAGRLGLLATRGRRIAQRATE